MCSLGIDNLGNNCYINAILQAFRYVQPISKKLFTVQANNPLIDSLLNMLYNSESDNQSGDLKNLLRQLQTIGIDPYCQGDAHEFYLTMMDKLESYVRAGKLVSTLTCKCGYTLKNTELFSSISINGDVVDGILKYQDPETVCAVCENCGHVGLEKQLSIHPSNLFVIHLKRFTEHEKLYYNVSLPKILTVGNKKFKLAAVCNHHGNIFGGHYTCCALTKQGWYMFNDERARKIDGLPEKSKLPYILFYNYIE
jgi:ubiquitin C-terminal hydrolase